jgi:hypothetical protein
MEYCPQIFVCVDLYNAQIIFLDSLCGKLILLRNYPAVCFVCMYFCCDCTDLSSGSDNKLRSQYRKCDNITSTPSAF